MRHLAGHGAGGLASRRLAGGAAAPTRPVAAFIAGRPRRRGFLDMPPVWPIRRPDARQRTLGFLQSYARLACPTAFTTLWAGTHKGQRGHHH